jgi:tetratricopeptide (TPR) repeat protein
MAENKVQVVESGDALLKMESFWKKNSKQILIVLGVIVAGIIGWYGYQSMVVQPKEDDAANIIFKAEQDFRIDSLNLALKGNPATKSKGFLYIVNNYSGTKAGNLSKYYSGLCYLRTGDFNNAVKYLSDFSTDAKQIQMTAYGALADAYGELGKNDDAITYYKKAAETFDEDQALASEYLFRAGLKLEVMGKTKEAIEVYKQVKEKFPKTDRGALADKYIYRLSIEPNDFSSK